MSTAAKEPGTSFRRKMYFLAFVLVLGLAYVLRGVLVPLFLAFLLAYALDPFVDRLEVLRVPRPLGAILVMLGIAGLFTVVLIYAIPLFVDEVADASTTLPEKIRRLQARIEPWFAQQLHVKLPHSVNDLSKAAAERLQGGAAWDTGRTALFGTLGYVGVALSALIVPVFALYLLIDFDRIVNKVEQLIPRRWSPGISSVARDIHKTLSGYVRGQLTANVVLAALYATGLRVVDIRLAVPIGVMTGMLAFVPYVGFTAGLLFALGMAILDWQSAGTVVGVIAVMGGVQIIDAMVITPRIVGRSVGLAPLEVILTMMAAGSLFGFLGVLLAVPLGAVAKILIQRAVRAYLASSFYNKPAESPIETVGSVRPKPPSEPIAAVILPPAPAIVVPQPQPKR
ncbi:MAG: AI-2E family transporter [Labilithrix sp.]|nr:AI-2E family transporter [Labilithrix sp.]MCW5816304.1 AI-2E family transporter [Labilithrix sp.]